MGTHNLTKHKIVYGDKFPYEGTRLLNIELDKKTLAKDKRALDDLTEWLTRLYGADENNSELLNVAIYELLDNTVKYSEGEKIKVDLLKKESNLLFSTKNKISPTNKMKCINYLKEHINNNSSIYANRVSEEIKGEIGLYILKDVFNGLIRYIFDDEENIIVILRLTLGEMGQHG